MKQAFRRQDGDQHGVYGNSISTIPIRIAGLAATDALELLCLFEGRRVLQRAQWRTPAVFAVCVCKGAAASEILRAMDRIRHVFMRTAVHDDVKNIKIGRSLRCRLTLCHVERAKDCSTFDTARSTPN